MAAIYDYTGIVEAVLEKQTFPTGFVKQDIVLTDDVDVQTKFPNHIAFTFKKENCDLLAGVRPGQRAKVRFAIEGRVWQDPKTGKNRYFTDLTALKFCVTETNGSSAEPTPSSAGSTTQSSAGSTTPDAAAAKDEDSLPF